MLLLYLRSDNSHGVLGIFSFQADRLSA